MNTTMPTIGVISGGGNIPFEVAPYQSRVTISSQNCYLFNDNGTAKAHVELNCTAAGTISANNALLKNFPLQANIPQSLTLGGISYTIEAASNETYMKKATSTASGQAFAFNFDYEI